MTTRYQKRHYEDVAGLLRHTVTHHPAGNSTADGAVIAMTQVMVDFANLFAADNLLFDRARFLAACGLESEGT